MALNDTPDDLKPTVARNLLNNPVWMVVEFNDADKKPRIIDRGMTSARLWALSDLLKKEADRRYKKSKEETALRR